MTADWKPGTVAVVTLNGRKHRVFRDGYHRQWVTADEGEIGRGADITDVRPLVVLDLDESVGKDWLPRWLRSNADYIGRESAGGDSALSKDMRWIADQIEAQTKPPRIPEPEGLWGVVEASARDSARFEWVRHPEGWTATTMTPQQWDSLIDPVLIREGVES